MERIDNNIIFKSFFQYWLKTFIPFLLLSLPQSFFSQTNGSVFSFKPVIGINACQIHGDNASGYNKFGVNGGMMVNSHLNKKASIDIGIVFSQKGAAKNQNIKNGDYTFFRINLYYVEVPLLLNYKANQTYFITLGPSLGYLASSNVWTDQGNLNDLYHFNRFEYAVNLGLGRKIKGNWFVEVRSTNSFAAILNYGAVANNVFYPNPVARFFNKGLYNNILSAYVTYVLTPKKKSETIQ